MRNKITHFLTALAITVGMITASATPASVTTVPHGMMSFKLIHGTTNYLSLPLTNSEIYTSTVDVVTSNTISVSDTPAPFTTSLAVSGSPYFVKFLSGNESGRVMLITGNTSSVLTLDTADHATGLPIALDTANFNVQPGDAFEIFPGDTIASIFGDNSAQRPLILAGNDTAVNADSVSLYTSVNTPATSYFFSTIDNRWEQIGTGSNASANATIIYPYSAFAVDRRMNQTDVTLVVTGRVTGVAIQTKVVGMGTVLSSTHCATDVKLSQIQFGSNWVTGTSVTTVDTLSVWNRSVNHFDTYYQMPDSTWRKLGDAVTDRSNFAIPAGTVTAIAKREVVTGANTFLASALPYTP